MHDSLEGSSDKQDSEMVVVVKDGMNHGWWKVGVLEPSTTLLQLVIILEGVKLYLQQREVLVHL